MSKRISGKVRYVYLRMLGNGTSYMDARNWKEYKKFDEYEKFYYSLYSGKPLTQRISLDALSKVKVS